MSVNPGFGGQSFIPSSIEKIKQLKQMAERLNPNLIIEVDGGVSPANIKMLSDCGVSAVVAGSAVFKSDKPETIISQLKQA